MQSKSVRGTFSPSHKTPDSMMDSYWNLPIINRKCDRTFRGCLHDTLYIQKQPTSLFFGFTWLCAAELLHVTRVIAIRSTPLFSTHISTAMRNLSALKLRIGHLPCPLKLNSHVTNFKIFRQNIMWGAEHIIILPQKQVYAFGAFSATCWHAGQRQPSVPSVNIEPFKFVIKLWLL